MNNEAKEVTKLVENSELRRRDIDHAWHELEQARSTQRDENRLDNTCEITSRHAEQFLRELNGIQEELHYGRKLSDVSKRLDALKRKRRAEAEQDYNDVRNAYRQLVQLYQNNIDVIHRLLTDMEKALNGVVEDVEK